MARCRTYQVIYQAPPPREPCGTGWARLHLSMIAPPPREPEELARRLRPLLGDIADCITTAAPARAPGRA